MSRQVPVVELEYEVYYSFLPAIRIRRTKYRVGTSTSCLLACYGCGQIVLGYTEYEGDLDDCLARTAADVHAAIIMHHGYTPPSWKC